MEGQHSQHQLQQQQQQHNVELTELSKYTDADTDDHRQQRRQGVFKHHRSSFDTLDSSHPPRQNNNNNNMSSNSSSASLTRARRLLYVSHAMAQFSEVAWQFCLILFLAAFSNYQSLFLVSTYGLVNGLVVCSLGGVAGRHVDASHRLRVAQEFIWTENTCVVLATVCCYLLLGRQRAQQDTFHHNNNSNNETSIFPTDHQTDPLQAGFQSVPQDAVSLTLLVLIHILGAVAAVLDLGFSVAMERDWIVVMSRHASVVARDKTSNETNDSDSYEEGDDVENRLPDPSVHSSIKWLSETNVAMRQIDLSCKIIAPAMAGFFVSFWNHPSTTTTTTTTSPGGSPSSSSSASSSSSSTRADLRGAAILVGALNVAALVIEYLCTKQIYHLIPDLANKNEGEESRTMAVEATELELVVPSNCEQALRSDSQPSEGPSCRKRFGLPHGLSVYLQQPTALGGIGLALLYLNVLSFGGIMTAYLVWRGMQLETVGIWRGVSCVVGLLGTFAYHTSVKYLRLETTALWSIVAQFACLSISYASLWVENYTVSLAMLIGGVCASRVGLWVFDIAITQLMQLQVPDNMRGVVGGVQQSLNAFFDLLAFGIGLFLPDPREFHVYVAAGYASVGIAMFLYGFDFVRKTQTTKEYKPVAPTCEDETEPHTDMADL